MENLAPLALANLNLATIDIADSLAKAYSLMTSRHIRHLIVTKNGMVTGMLSDRDVMRAVNIQVHDFYSVRVREEHFEKSAKVGDVMGWPVQTLDVEAPLTEVVDMMLTRKISCVLLTRNAAVTGIITTDDLLKVLKKIIAEQALHKDAHPSSLQILLGKIYASPVGTLFDSLSSSGI